jgi:hypothetical protein
MAKSWVPGELRVFRQVLRQGGTFADVGLALSRSVQEVWVKAQEIGFHMERKERGWEDEPKARMKRKKLAPSSRSAHA